MNQSKPHGLTKHGLSKTPVYVAWTNMRSRCKSNSVRHIKYYKGKGIAVCDRWNVFENFLTDMGVPPSPQMELDRIDNSKGYEPHNCRWVPRVRNQRNRTNTVIVNFRGVRLPISDLADVLSVRQGTLYQRVAFRGYSVEEAVMGLKTKPDLSKFYQVYKESTC